MAVPSVVLGVGGLIGYAALGSVNDIVRPAAVEIDAESVVYSLLRWPGLTTAFGWSVVIVAVGALVGWAAARPIGAGREIVAPRPFGAHIVDRGLDQVVVVAREITARLQHGSLPVYVVTMSAVAALATIPFAVDLDLDAIRGWDSIPQAVLAAAVVLAAIAAATVTSRLGAAISLGAVGIAVSGLFVVHGAPDLALTQLLVETVVVVGFVVGLGSLARRFPPVGAAWNSTRLAVAVLLGVDVMVAQAASAGAPAGEPPLRDLTALAVDEGGGNNVVNVILTDIRALDTLGEIIVLVVVAVGILSLARHRGNREGARS